MLLQCWAPDGLQPSNARQDYFKLRFIKLMSVNAEVSHARAPVKAQLTAELWNPADRFPGFRDGSANNNNLLLSGRSIPASVSQCFSLHLLFAFL